MEFKMLIIDYGGTEYFFSVAPFVFLLYHIFKQTFGGWTTKSLKQFF